MLPSGGVSHVCLAHEYMRLCSALAAVCRRAAPPRVWVPRARLSSSTIVDFLLLPVEDKH
eukprot:735604-Prymnesium_polylepis.1